VRMIRRAEQVNDVYVITDARWPRGDRFTQDRRALFAQMRAEAMVAASVVRPADFINISLA